MTGSEIDILIRQGEGLRLEFKAAGNKVPRSFFETVVSFSNTDGGDILLGVEDNGAISGINPTVIDSIQKEIVTALNSNDCINPPLYIQPIRISHPAGLILVIQVQCSSQVHDHAGKIYYREYDADLNISRDQHKIGDIYLRKRNLFTEATIYPFLSIDDLDFSLFEKARTIIRNNRSDHPWLFVGNDQMLKDSNLWRKDYSTGTEGLSLAASLIFGKETTIQNLLPAYKVEVMVRKENVDRWDDRLTLRKNLIDTYLELKQFINRYLPEKFYLEGDQRIDLRDRIFREVIGNLIVHREYTSAYSSELILSNTEVVLTNPNKPLFHGVIDPARFNPFPKNPNIRKFFTAFGWTDEIGSGIRNTYKYLPLYIPGAKPVFLENETFETRIPLRWITIGSFREKIRMWLDLPDQCTDHFTAALATLPAPSSMPENDWNSLLLHLVGAWFNNATEFPGLDWQRSMPETKSIKYLQSFDTDNQLYISDEIQKVPSWNEKSTKLLTKRNRYLITILLLAAAPIDRELMMGFLNYSNRKTFNDLYLKPLLEQGLLKRTKEQPRAADQQYVTTETGRSFLTANLRKV